LFFRICLIPAGWSNDFSILIFTPFDPKFQISGSHQGNYLAGLNAWLPYFEAGFIFIV